jgi:hypothetical protein
MRILGYILVVLFVTTSAMGQQINPVPDYIFRYQMSVGRNAPTDTAAYLSVGPRYGANKGLMPPMVVDTNAVTGTKRNGLLIFSVQLNNFAYWDSTTSRFRQITAQAVVDSVVFATRAWRKKGDDSLGAVIATRTDTALLSTKAYRQKGVDSLVTLISTLGGGTVLSVSSGYGTNFSTITTTGSVVVDSLVITSRASRDKLKDSLNANIALKVNISDTSTMLSAYLRKADTTSMLSPYLRKGDTTAMLSPYVRTAGFGLTKGTQTLSVDSALMATRARVQKGIDSVASLVTTTDSVVFSTREWRQKGVDSVAALANTKATATGTTNYLSKFTGTSSLGNSIVYATTSEVGISTPSPTHPLDVNGRVRVRTIDSTASPINFLTTDNDGVIRKTTPFTGTVSSVATGFGLSGGTITTTGTLVADTNSMATRARVQKAVDSLNVNIAAKGSGTVTSVAAGTGMSFTTITSTGSVAADTVVLSTRAWRQKGIDSVAGLSRVTGSGTTNYVAKFTGSTAIGNSSIFDNGSAVSFGSASPLGGIPVQFHMADPIGLLRTTDNAFGPGIDFYKTRGSLASPTDVSNGDLIYAERAAPYSGGYKFLNSYRLIVDGTFTSGQNPPFRHSFFTNAANGTPTERFRIRGDGEIGIDAAGTFTDAGAYALQVAGSIYNTTGAVFAATSGNIGIGIINPDRKLIVSVSPSGSNVTDGFRVTDGTRNLSTVITSSTYTYLGMKPNSGMLYNNANLFLAVDGGDAHISMNNTQGEGFRFTKNSEFLLGDTTDYGDIRLQVNGRIRAATIDSTASAINMLYADANGVIKKTAVPASSVTMSTDNMTAASGWTIAYDKTQAYPVNDVNKTVDGSIATVTINTAAYRTTATFNTDQWVHVATVPSGFRPNSDVYFSLPNTVAGASFRSTSSVAFTSYNFYQEEAAVRVLPNGNVEVFVGLVSNSADLSGANYVIMPIAVTYNIETYPS